MDSAVGVQSSIASAWTRQTAAPGGGPLRLVEVKPLVTREELEMAVKEARGGRERLIDSSRACKQRSRGGSCSCAHAGGGHSGWRGRVRAEQAERVDGQRGGAFGSTSCGHHAARPPRAAFDAPLAQEGVLKRLALLNRPLKFIGASFDEAPMMPALASASPPPSSEHARNPEDRRRAAHRVSCVLGASDGRRVSWASSSWA